MEYMAHHYLNAGFEPEKNLNFEQESTSDLTSETAPMTPDEKFAQLGLTLPPAPKPMGVYKPCLIVDKFVYVSGHGPVKNDGSRIIGRIGAEMNIDEGKLAAQQVGLTILATLKAKFGTLNKIKRVIKTLGMVNATADFERHPFVINGCSELFVAVWGEDNGVGVRSAVGMGTLPENIPVEIEVMFELED
ncbi:RidA family protein [Larkinella ripae]